jgi:hypothetical protein
MRNAYRARVNRRLDDMESGTVPVRMPLTAGQHILHLLLSVFTCGLWVPVWIVRSIQGNKTYRQQTQNLTASTDAA